jgi:hypothetical protein
MTLIFLWSPETELFKYRDVVPRGNPSWSLQ